MKLIVTTTPFQEEPTAEAIREVFNAEETLSEYVSVFHTVAARTVRVNFNDAVAADVATLYADALTAAPTVTAVKVRRRTPGCAIPWRCSSARAMAGARIVVLTPRSNKAISIPAHRK